MNFDSISMCTCLFCDGISSPDVLLNLQFAEHFLIMDSVTLVQGYVVKMCFCPGSSAMLHGHELDGVFSNSKSALYLIVLHYNVCFLILHATFDLMKPFT